MVREQTCCFTGHRILPEPMDVIEKRLLEAVEAGLIQKCDGGDDIGPFLRFWDAFSKYLPLKGKERPNEMGDLLEMLNHEGEGAASDDAQQS